MIGAFQFVAVGLFLQGIISIAAASPVSFQSAASWSNIKASIPEQFLKLSIGLEPKESEALEKVLLSVSDPSNRQYGKHLSREEAKALLRPHPESTQAVHRWLADAGIPHNRIEDQGQFIHAHLSVDHLDNLLNIRSYLSTQENRTPTALHDSVPLELRHHIATIQPTLVFGDTTLQGNTIYPKFPVGHLKRATAVRLDNNTARTQPADRIDFGRCKSKLTPECLRRLYNIDELNVRPHKKSLLGIVGFNKVSPFERMTSCLTNSF
jgi:tripeptidyl-peptidase-1